MGSSKYKVNHFVSDFLLEPWKATYKSNRGIWCYDFSDNRIHHRSPKRVFARNRVFTPEMEQRYNKLIETPISRYLKSLEAGKELENSDWEIQRALFLIFLAQSPRVGQALDPGKDHSFSEFLGQDDLTINSLVYIMTQHSNLVRVRAPMQQPLFCPLIGIFPIAYQDEGSHSQWSFALGVPITPYIALVVVSKSVTSETINYLPLWSNSVGLAPRTTCVVIPPFIAENVDHDKITDNILFARSTNTEMFQLVSKAGLLIEELSNRMGLIVEKVPGSLHSVTVAKVPSI